MYDQHQIKKMAQRLAQISSNLTRPTLRYDEKIASKAMQLSYEAYQFIGQYVFYPSFKLERKFKPTGILGIKDLFGFIGVDKQIDRIIVCFRGTKPLSFINWMRDASMMQIQYTPNNDTKTSKNVNIHKGFYDCLQLFKKDNLFQTVAKLLKQYPTYKVVYSGHSLGGAIANVAAAIHKDEFKQIPIQLYTFGQPRVGNASYSDFVDEIIPNNFRIINQMDIVPHVPFTSTLLQYQHGGYEIWYQKGTTLSFQYFKGDSKNGSSFREMQIQKLLKSRPLNIVGNLFEFGINTMFSLKVYNAGDHMHFMYNRLKEKSQFKVVDLKS